MFKKLVVTEEYLYIPISVGKEERKLEIFLEEEASASIKLYEFMVPVDPAETEVYDCDYFAFLPVRELAGKWIAVCVDAPEAFGESIYNGKKRPSECGIRPLLHFTAEKGWINDPNGLIYADGVYHLYFQYNPFHTVWNNMSWGHAVSRDLLHWTQEEPVMYPDESGSIFSGCAIANDRGMLGLPEDALLYFYTAAGGENAWSEGRAYTQKMACSLDGGSTLIRQKEPCLPTIFQENRDPKVYWHDPSGAYVMALYLQGNEFGLFRSVDLERWEETDRFTLEKANECPDLFPLTTEEGETCWFFWTADGFYYAGDFDGYRFQTDGIRHHAYVTGIPYAAQTYSGVMNRRITIPWLRLKNDGRLFTGAMGIPTELTAEKTPDGFVLRQRPVRELMEQAEKLSDHVVSDGKWIRYTAAGSRKALVAELTVSEEGCASCVWHINGSRMEYRPETGRLTLDEEAYQVGCGHQEFLLLIDDRILELFFDQGLEVGTFALKEAEVTFEASCEGIKKYVFYEVK